MRISAILIFQDVVERERKAIDKVVPESSYNRYTILRYDAPCLGWTDVKIAKLSQQTPLTEE